MALFERKPIVESGVAIVKKGNRNSVGLKGEDNHHDRETAFLKYKDAYDRVPLVTAIVDVQSDQAVQDFFFEGPNSTKLDKWADKVNLMQFFHKTAKLMVLYGNSYVETIREGGEIVELKILDPIYMNVFRKITGDIIGYSQIIGDKKLVLWGTTGSQEEDRKYDKKVSKTESISHFKHNVLGSEKYGSSIVKPLVASINTKLEMEGSLSKVLFKYVAPLIWAKVGNDQFPANDAVVTSISNTLRDLSAESEITTSHLVELQVMDFNAKGMDIKTPIEHVEQQIITGGQVPPVLLGRAGQGKADSEVQLRSFGRHIKALQRELKNEFEEKIVVGQEMGTEEDKLVWAQAEEREREVEIDMLRGLVTDGVITPQKANDLLPPKFREKLPEPTELLNGQGQDETGMQKPRPTQRKAKKVTDNPNDPTQTTKDKKTLGKRVNKTDRSVPIK
jgi:hypothetical protein